MIRIGMSFSQLYGHIGMEAKGENSDKVDVGVGVWTESPIDPEWVGAKCPKDRPFFMATRDESGKLTKDMCALIKDAHIAYETARSEHPESSFKASRRVTRDNMCAAFYELCTYVGGRKKVETCVGEIQVVVLHADGPEAAEASQDAVSKYLAGLFASHELCVRG